MSEEAKNRWAETNGKPIRSKRIYKKKNLALEYSDGEERIIIKYKNRKLYDKTLGAYINNSFVNEALQKGWVIVMIDKQGTK